MTALVELERSRVLPVLTLRDPADALPVCAALVEGGLACAEITLRTEHALDAIAAASRVDGIRVGAGSSAGPISSRRSAVPFPAFDSSRAGVSRPKTRAPTCGTRRCSR